MTLEEVKKRKDLFVVEIILTNTIIVNRGYANMRVDLLVLR